MSNLLPAKIERVFAVSPTGETSVVKPGPPKKLSLGQRHAAWRIGLMAVNQFMKEQGFESVIGASTTHFGWLKGDFSVNVSLRQPSNIAYVTSYEGYDPHAKKKSLGKDITGHEMFGVTAQVTTLKEALGGGKYVLMVDASTLSGTANPVYIPLEAEDDGGKPAQYVYRNVLGVIAMMAQADQGLKDAFAADQVRLAQERQVQLD